MPTFITTIFALPKYQDGGYSALIESLASQQLEIAAFLPALNSAGSLPDMNQLMLLQYISDRQNVGDMLEISVQGDSLPSPISRQAQPGGMGQDGSAIWFSTPSSGTVQVAWFVNGTLKIKREQDLSSNRSATKAELGCQAGDIVQVCIVSQNVSGWWNRLEVT